MVENVSTLRNQGGTMTGSRPATATRASATAPAATAVPVQAEESAPARKSPLPLIAGVVIVLLLVVGGIAAFVLPQLTADPVPVITLPDGFQRIETANYSIGVPRALLPAVNDYIDQSTPDRILHRWQRDDDVFVTVALVNADRVTLDAYFDTYYDDLIADDDTDADDATDNPAAPTWYLIDEETAPNGMLRRSYRVQDDETLANGQIDLFFVERGGFLTVIEMYTSDEIAADQTMITELQTILDSLLVKASA
jgi:hypothetical protein